MLFRSRLLADDEVVALLELDDFGLGVHALHRLEATNDGLLVSGDAGDLEEEIVTDTLNVILKYEGDVKKAQSELGKLIEKKTAAVAAEAPQGKEAPKPAESKAKKGVLH